MFKHLSANPKLSKGRLYNEFEDDQFRTAKDRLFYSCSSVQNEGKKHAKLIFE